MTRLELIEQEIEILSEGEYNPHDYIYGDLRSSWQISHEGADQHDFEGWLQEHPPLAECQTLREDIWKWLEE